MYLNLFVYYINYCKSFVNHVYIICTIVHCVGTHFNVVTAIFMATLKFKASVTCFFY